MSKNARIKIPKPVFRKLRVFALDPGTTARFDTAVKNEMTLSIPWEDLEPGPIGEYVSVVDQDENGKVLHEPVDLDSPDLLGQCGLTPSDGNPQFRQQMLYAVSMWTIRNFERSLGRLVHWPQTIDLGAYQQGMKRTATVYEKQIKLYPHYLKDANCYYDPKNQASVFGYFSSMGDSSLPTTCVFTCLSPDVIAHTLTHALLMGMGIQFDIDEDNLEGMALHEAFADLIGLLQHFWESDVLRMQIAEIRGLLDEHSMLGAVAPQFGQAIGKPDGLRNALGTTDDSGRWTPIKPDPEGYRSTTEPHALGNILVCAVFSAFKKIYETRISDFRRIATRGTGILPQGSLHPDLVNRITQEVSKSARHVLDMCIRALDYLPPVNVTFSDFLRAVVTADFDIEADDPLGYRTSFVDAFRNYGIIGSDVRTLSVDSLMWPIPSNVEEASQIAEYIKRLSKKHTHWNLPREREENWNLLLDKRRELFGWLKKSADSRRMLGGVDLSKPFKIQSFHPRERPGLAGDLSFYWVIKIVQKLASQDSSRKLIGCTLLVDAETGFLRYRIVKSDTGRSPDAAQRKSKLLELTSSQGLHRPRNRRLRVFAFDPSLGVQLETAGINEITLDIPWERDRDGNDILMEGPVGEYIEVVDRDPASGCCYTPVDLNDPNLLAQDGLQPSENNPQFHQQMVYAVAMRTIRTFEHALGRLALWSPRFVRSNNGAKEENINEQYIQRLRLYPHALRESNAYYSPSKKAILFGYFSAPVAGSSLSTARQTVFTCLSHDIVVHEVTHALLDGMHRRFREPTNPDVLAFHEAFADIVALFQHFSLPDVLRHQIAATRGDLASQNKLGELAQQFGQAIGKRGALRSAIGSRNETTGQWEPLEPDPEAYSQQEEPHRRGAILVAAVFNAFLTIYKAKVTDLLRIASEGTGVLPEGHLHPDLVARLAEQAAKSARFVLDVCIRALDYCPPVDITFGDYLRAIVTADFETNPVDKAHRRVAFVEAFRRHGIIPDDVRTLSVDGLLWRPTASAPDEDEDVILEIVKEWAADIAQWNLSKSREDLFYLMYSKRLILHNYLAKKLKNGSAFLSSIESGRPFEVHSIRPSTRTDWEGRSRFQWVIELTQRIPQFVESDVEEGGKPIPDYYFRGGCTLLVDTETGKVRYSIKKKLDGNREARQRQYFKMHESQSLAATYFGESANQDDEPFAMLHRD